MSAVSSIGRLSSSGISCRARQHVFTKPQYSGIVAGFFGRVLSARIDFGYWVFEGDLQAPQRPSSIRVVSTLDYYLAD